MGDVKISCVLPSIRPAGVMYARDSLMKQTFKEFEFLTEISVHTGDGTDLNAAYNKMLRRARGELIVFIQDYIEFPSCYLEKFWVAHKENPIFYTAPVGKCNYDNEDVKWDWRYHRDGICSFAEWEIDSGSAPLKALKEIGGFDEKLDKYWGFDNVNVGLRADLAGWKIKCLKDNLAYALDHDSIIEHPFRKLRNPDFHNEILDDIRRGLKMNYLN